MCFTVLNDCSKNAFFGTFGTFQRNTERLQSVAAGPPFVPHVGFPSQDVSKNVGKHASRNVPSRFYITTSKVVARPLRDPLKPRPHGGHDFIAHQLR